MIKIRICHGCGNSFKDYYLTDIDGNWLCDGCLPYRDMFEKDEDNRDK